MKLILVHCLIIQCQFVFEPNSGWLRGLILFLRNRHSMTGLLFYVMIGTQSFPVMLMTFKQSSLYYQKWDYFLQHFLTPHDLMSMYAILECITFLTNSIY